MTGKSANRTDAAVRPMAPDGSRSRLHAVIPAAGAGLRFGSALPKQYQLLGEDAVIVHTLRAVLQCDRLEHVWVVVAPDDRMAHEVLAPLLQAWPSRWAVCPIGGATRRDSVLAGLEHARDQGAHWVLVHDAARPLLRQADVEALIDNCLRRGGGGILARPVVDTVKRVVLPQPDACTTPAQALIETVPREGLWLAQTPQMFEVEPLIQALRCFPEVTDECAAIERAGGQVFLVEGSHSNLKLTTPQDLAYLEEQLAVRRRQEEPAFRIGQGYDVHALVPGRRLMLGGVAIDFPRGLLGHSDADVLLHAVCDAILGAAGLGDIGSHFPDQDARWRGVDSAVLLRQCVEMARARGWEIANLDCSIVAQAPKIAPYREAIIKRVAECLGVRVDQVNVKAKTQELLGFEGRGEGISAQAVVLLRRSAAVDQAR